MFIRRHGPKLTRGQPPKLTPAAIAVGAMPPKLTPAAIAGTLDELAKFADTNAATLAARNGTDMFSLLRHN